MADNTKVLMQVHDIHKELRIEDSDYGILVGQPCMWSGGIQPVLIKVTDKCNEDYQMWYVNASMRLPLAMCSPFAADYGGGEMTLFVLKHDRLKAECRSFSWNWWRSSPHRVISDASLVLFMIRHTPDLHKH